MKLIELIDSHFKRQALLNLIRKEEKELKDIDRNISSLESYSKKENWKHEDKIAVAKELFREKDLCQKAISLYKEKLNRLL